MVETWRRSNFIVAAFTPRIRAIACASLCGLLSPSRLAIPTLLLGAALAFPVSYSHAEGQSMQQNPSNAPAADGTSVAGVVVGEDGKPIGGADVSLLRRGAYRGKMVPRRMTANGDGKFLFDGVANGDYRIWALSDNLASRDKRLQGQILHLPLSGRDPVKLIMRPGRIIRVNVTSAADGKPIGGALLHLTWTDTVADFKTDATGHVSIEALTPESWQLEATAPGKAKVIKSINLASATEVAADFSLSDGGSLSGKVTETDGKPARGVGLNVYPGDTGIPTDYVTTADDGTYKLDNLPLEQRCRLLLTDGNGSGADTWENITLSAAHRKQELNVALKPKPIGLSVSGTVVDPDGKPVAGARVMYYGDRFVAVTTVRTDPNGAFRLSGIQPFDGVPEQIIVRADGWAPVAVAVEQLQASSAAAPLAVRLTEKGHRIAGRVENDKGKPIEGARVEAGSEAAPDRRGVSMTTGADGQFQFDSLDSRATFDVSASGFSEINWKHLAVDGKGIVTVVMQERAAIVGKVVDADTGRSIPKFNIKIRMNGVESSREETGEEFGGDDGAFRLDNLQAGSKAILVVTAEGYPVQYFDQTTIVGGNAQPIAIRLSKDPPDHIRLAGRIVDSAGKPLPGVEVRAVSYAQVESAVPKEFRFDWGMLKSGQLAIQTYVCSIDQTRTTAEGTFAFASIKGPDIDLAYWGGGVPATRLGGMGTQPAAKREHLELHVPAPATLSGSINLAVYPDATGLTLHSLTDQSWQLDFPLRENADQYAIPDLPPGAYELLINGKHVRDEDGTFSSPRIGTAEVKVAEGESKRFDLGFGKGDVPATQPER